MRVQATRVPGFCSWTASKRQDFGVDGEVAYAIGANGMATPSSTRSSGIVAPRCCITP